MKIRFQDFEESAKVFKSEIERYIEQYEGYLKSISNISSCAIVSGEAAEVLRFVVAQLTAVTQVPQGIGNRLTTLVDGFLTELHKAQVVDGTDILYSRDYSELRDYSSEYFFNLRGAVEEADYNDGIINWIWDAMEDSLFYLVAKIFGHCDTSSKDNLKRAQSNLIQFKDVTARRLIDIKNHIEEIAERYASYMGSIESTMSTLNEMMHKFQNLFEGYYMHGQGLSEANIVDFASLYTQMMEHYNDVLVAGTISDEDVEAFIKSDISHYLQDEHISIIRGYLGDLSTMDFGDWEAYSLLLFQLFGIAEAEIATLGNSEQLFMKKELLDLLEEVGDSFNYEDTELHEKTDFIRDVLGYIKDGGKFWQEHYEGDKRFKEYRDVVEFLDTVDNISDILKYGDDAITYLTTIFADFSKNLAFLDSVEKNYVADGVMKGAFDEIRALYEKELSGIVMTGWETVREYGIDALYSVSVGKVVGSIKEGINFVGEVTGENARTAAQLELLTCGYDMLSMAEQAFNNAVDTLRELTPDNEAYKGAVNDVKNTFQIYKQTMVQMYEKMAIASDGDERSYYYYCSREAAQMELSDLGNQTIMTKEEFINSGLVW